MYMVSPRNSGIDFQGGLRARKQSTLNIAGLETLRSYQRDFIIVTEQETSKS